MIYLISLIVSTATAQTATEFSVEPARVFRADSPLPIELQKLTLRKIAAQCPALISQLKQMTEEKTSVEPQGSEQLFDTFYHTMLNVVTEVNGQRLDRRLYIWSIEANKANPVTPFEVAHLGGCP